MLGFPHPRDFHRWKFLLCYRVKLITTAMLICNEKCNSGFVVYSFFLSISGYLLLMLSPTTSQPNLLSLLFPQFSAYFPLHASTDPSLKDSFQLCVLPAWQNFVWVLNFSINFCFNSSLLIQYWDVYDFLHLTELFSVNSLLSFYHHDLHVPLENFRHPLHHKVIFIFVFIVLSLCLFLAQTFSFSQMCNKSHLRGNGSEIYLCQAPSYLIFIHITLYLSLSPTRKQAPHISLNIFDVFHTICATIFSDTETYNWGQSWTYSPTTHTACITLLPYLSPDHM